MIKYRTLINFKTGSCSLGQILAVLITGFMLSSAVGAIAAPSEVPKTGQTEKVIERDNGDLKKGLTLPEAMETLANKTQTKITLIGDIKSTTVNSIKIESQSIPEMIKTILKRYGVDNYAIIYEDKANVIKIRLVGSSSSKENNIYPTPQSDQSIVSGKLTPTRMFSDQDFARLLEKDRAITQEREFSEEDFARLLEKEHTITQEREFSEEDFVRLRERNVTMTQHREFSIEDFSRIKSQKTKIKQYPIFSSDDFERVQKNQIRRK